jgi:DNA polymerase III delta subunit
MLDQATKKASAGDTGSAIDLLQRVAAQQCAFPRLARTAQRALRRLQK